MRLDYFGKISKRGRARLVELNPSANKKARSSIVGQTPLLAWERYENHRNGYKGQPLGEEVRPALDRGEEWKPDFVVACKGGHSGLLAS